MGTSPCSTECLPNARFVLILFALVRARSFARNVCRDRLHLRPVARFREFFLGQSFPDFCINIASETSARMMFNRRRLKIPYFCCHVRVYRLAKSFHRSIELACTKSIVRFCFLRSSNPLPPTILAVWLRV